MKRIFSLLLVLFFCSSALAQPIKQIVFFGDSLSDSGNLYQVIKILPKSPPYYRGRFSNGPTWAENVGKYYYDKYYTDYVNYAYGGAVSYMHTSFKKDTFLSPITITEEIYSYLAHTMFADRSQVLYVIWIGANDYLDDISPDVNAEADGVVNQISWVLTTLMSHGAQNFLILNLPDLSKTPYARAGGYEDKLHVMTQLHNEKLAEMINQLKTKYPATRFATVDIYSVFDELVAHPEKFNQRYGQQINNTMQSCWGGGFLVAENNKAALQNRLSLAQQRGELGKDVNPAVMSNFILNSPSLKQAYQIGETPSVPCDHPNQYIFWDALHPTAAVHQILGEIVEQTLTDSGYDFFHIH